MSSILHQVLGSEQQPDVRSVAEMCPMLKVIKTCGGSLRSLLKPLHSARNKLRGMTIAPSRESF
jgi:hypothetical protein